MGADLEAFLRLQDGLQKETYGFDLRLVIERRRVEYIRDQALALTHEVHEALDEVPWKPWRNNFQEFYTERYLDELVDVFAFLMNMMLATGADPAELAKVIEEKYMLKHKLNIQRRTNGY